MSKGNTGDPTVVVTPAFGVQDLGNNQYRFQGLWPVGQQIRVRIQTTDPQGDVGNYEYIVTLPPGAPPEGWNSNTAVAVVTSEIDPQPHVQASVAGNVVTLAPAAPNYLLESTIEVI